MFHYKTFNFDCKTNFYDRKGFYFIVKIIFDLIVKTFYDCKTTRVLISHAV